MNNQTPHLRQIALAVACVITGLSLTAHAHAFLDHSDPPAGAKLDTPPAQIKIWFTVPIDPAKSDVQLFDAQENQLDNKDTTRDPSDKTLLTITLPKLPPGHYTVRWHATTVSDGHKTKGDYEFEIAAER